MDPRMRFQRWTSALACVVSITGCGGEDSGPSAGTALDAAPVAVALDAVEASAIEQHIRVLAHDSLSGRAPGTPGYEGASRYVEARFAELGLDPAGVGGSFRQAVPLRQSLVNEAGSELTLHTDRETVALEYGTDYTLTPDAERSEVEVTAPVVFVGFGVSAPALGYDDYADVDVSGKIVAYMTGAPSSFPSNQRAYYSSGAVKAAEAESRGAVGMVGFTHRDDPRFRWNVGVARSRRGAFTWLDGAGRPRGRQNTSGLRGSASLNHDAVEALFATSPIPLAEILAAARDNEPQAVALPVEMTIRTVSSHRAVDSHNLVARLSGSDPDLADEHVVYVAHLDHFGVGDAMDGDSIYNGAHDNASGVAIVLEIARAFARLPEAPRRSILFLVATAEEWGLLGSDYFVRSPTVPGSSIVANLSLDMPFLFHPLLDIVPYGAEHSSLSRAVGAAAERLGIGLGPDPIPEQVLFIRSDHYSFVRAGIPALFIKSGFDTGDDRDGGAINTAFRQERYHTPFDESDQGFDFGAGVSHTRVNFLTGHYVAMADERPRWNEGDFFGSLFGAR